MRIKTKRDPLFDEITDELKRLALFTRCNKCACVGWKRPHANDSAVFDSDYTWIDDIDRDTECGRCCHSLGQFIKSKKFCFFFLIFQKIIWNML
jgi:hypothetical protein